MRDAQEDIMLLVAQDRKIGYENLELGNTTEKHNIKLNNKNGTMVKLAITSHLQCEIPDSSSGGSTHRV